MLTFINLFKLISFTKLKNKHFLSTLSTSCCSVEFIRCLCFVFRVVFLCFRQSGGLGCSIRGGIWIKKSGNSIQMRMVSWSKKFSPHPGTGSHQNIGLPHRLRHFERRAWWTWVNTSWQARVIKHKRNQNRPTLPESNLTWLYILNWTRPNQTMQKSFLIIEDINEPKD